jgi:DHA2 family multidrug resistance protein
MAMMLAVRCVIDRVDHRALLAIGLVTTAAALEFIARVPSQQGGLWLAAASAAQGIGVGLVFTPLSTIAFSTLAAELRTDAAGLYNLARQLGCATGVAMMTAILQMRIQAHFRAFSNQGAFSRLSPTHLHKAASVAAYGDCFRFLAIIALAMIPGICVFRVIRQTRTPAE